MADVATTILGIDQAIRHTGVARWRDGRLSTMTISPPPKAWTDEETFSWIAAHIWPIITARTFVVLEEPFVGRDPRGAMRLAGLFWHIRIGLRRRGVPFGVIGNAQLKQWATGHGNANKAQMIDMARATFGPGAGLRMGAWKPLVDDPQHEADALFAMSAGLFHVWITTQSAWKWPGMEPGISDDQQAIYGRVCVDREWPELEWEAL